MIAGGMTGNDRRRNVKQSTDYATAVQLHTNQPDYTRPGYYPPDEVRLDIYKKLVSLYGEERAAYALSEIDRMMRVYYAHKTAAMIEMDGNFDPAGRFTERDAVLIAYGDMVREPNRPPLLTLAEFARSGLRGLFSTIHLLPFFPSSSDRGFSVMDFEQVDPAIGDWNLVSFLRREFKLMFDGVFNHISSQSRWFREFLDQNPDYIDFFTVFSTREAVSDDHLRILFRPRTSEVLTPFDTLNGRRLVWTTFSPDQVDLNFQNPRVLLMMIGILLFYVRHGADLVRLDAVTYLWNELGTTGAHLEETHTVIRLMRTILDAAAPHVALVTETNVPHTDNIRYFGNGTDEAQMVYNFALPPLVLHAFQTGDATTLSAWAGTLDHVSDRATYFNFLDSHDGIGVMAARGILSMEEINGMAARVLDNGGHISYRTEVDGTVSPYELNITWWSAINRDRADEDEGLRVRRYLASRSIALALMGVPGIYLHGLLGSENDTRTFLEERDRRAINRATLGKNDLLRSLDDSSSRTARVFGGMRAMLLARSGEKCFHPNAPQRVLDADSGLFVLLRSAADGSARLLAATNVTGRPRELRLNTGEAGLPEARWTDILDGSAFGGEGGSLAIAIEPYGVRWLRAGA